MWQNELKEVIWLELQAWFAGTDVNIQDQRILNDRKLVDQVIEMVDTYRCDKCILLKLFLTVI